MSFAALDEVPALPSSYVSRPLLVERLRRARPTQLVLVSAPAGTGKTSVVAEWLRHRGPADVSWVSCADEKRPFWDALLSGLVRLGVGLPTGWRPAATTLGQQRLDVLCDLVVQTSRRLTVVVDGCHVTDRELGREIDHLLRRSMGRLRLVLISRVDPVFPLYRYAMTDSLVELRAADLAFTDVEAGQLIRSAGVEITDRAVHELNAGLNGWAAALHLAARALVGRTDPETDAATVVPQTVSLGEFVLEEVLNSLPADQRGVLLDASVPRLLCPDLVTAIAGPSASRRFDSFVDLRSFVEAVPERPGWFRLPPLLRRLLRAQLAFESPERVPALLRITADWLRREGMGTDALEHLTEIPAWDEVATEVVETMLTGRLVVEGPGSGLAAVARRIPDDIRGPRACLVRATAALLDGDDRRCTQELSRARTTHHERDDESPALALGLATVGALCAGRTGDARTASDLAGSAQRLLEAGMAGWVPRPAAALTAAVRMGVGMAALRRGDLDVATHAFGRAAQHASLTAAPGFRSEILGGLAIVEALAGRLWRATHVAEESLSCATLAGVTQAEVSPGASVALALVALERNDMESARDHLDFVAVSAPLSGHPVYRALAEAATAQVEWADGHRGSALERLQEAEEVAAVGDPWLACHLRLARARLLLVAGEAATALTVLADVEGHGRPDVDVVAAAAYAEQDDSAAVQRLLLSVRRGDNCGVTTRVSGLLVESMQRGRHKSPGRARAALDEALRLARPEQLCRPFREVGPALGRWLAADARIGQDGQGLEWLRKDDETPLADEEPRTAPVLLMEPLTAKEQEVLEHLAELLTTEELAQKMFVSVNTVRTHIRSILRKLGVSRRNAAIRRARELGLLER